MNIAPQASLSSATKTMYQDYFWIEPLQDGVYQLTHFSGARWFPSSLKACQAAAAKSWVLNRSHPAMASNQRGWCIANRHALELSWPYSLYKLYPSQTYRSITQLSDDQGVWRDIAYQKLLLGDEELVLIESQERTSKIQSDNISMSWNLQSEPFRYPKIVLQLLLNYA